MVDENREKWGTCDLSRRCTHRRRAADGRSVTETTMRSVEVVMLEPGGELEIAFLRVEVVANVGPLAQGGLDEAFGLASGVRGVWGGVNRWWVASWREGARNCRER